MRSIALGNRPFVESVKAFLGFRAKGRDVIRGSGGFQLREGPAHYNQELIMAGPRGNPELLHSASWMRILDQLDDHFGEEIELDPDSKKSFLII